MLRWRIPLGILFIAVVAALCWLDYDYGMAFLGVPRVRQPGTWLFPLALLLTLAASLEYANILKVGGWQTSRWVLCLGNLAIVGSTAASQYLHFSFLPFGIRWGIPLLTLALCASLSILIEVRGYDGNRGALVRLAFTNFGFIYIGILFVFVIYLRLFDNNDLRPLLSLIVTVKMGDTGAYLIGRLFGKHKMTPLLSPGKTWEGAFGGLAFACLGAWLVIILWPLIATDSPTLFTAVPTRGFHYPALNWLAFGLLVGCLGIFGDLAESLLKRETGVKNSSTWMPGLGGVLDLLDSILFAAPLVYFLWLATWKTY